MSLDFVLEKPGLSSGVLGFHSLHPGATSVHQDIVAVTPTFTWGHTGHS